VVAARLCERKKVPVSQQRPSSVVSVFVCNALMGLGLMAVVLVKVLLVVRISDSYCR